MVNSVFNIFNNIGYNSITDLYVLHRIDAITNLVIVVMVFYLVTQKKKLLNPVDEASSIFQKEELDFE